MKIGIDKLTCCENWHKLYSKLCPTKRSPYFSPSYYRAYKKVEEYPVECFWCYWDDMNFLFYPYLKRGINPLGYMLDNQYYDIIGAYGYNGPIGEIQEYSLIIEFNKQLRCYLQDQRIVTEFVRYSPIPDNSYYHTYLDKIEVLDNIYVDLAVGMDRVWSESYSQNLRTSIRKGSSYGLQSQIYHGSDISLKLLERGYGIYKATMDRNKAEEFYYFGMAFITEILDAMQSQLTLIVTSLNDIPVSFELVMRDGVLAYAILRGTDGNYFKLNPNTFQTHQLLAALAGIGVETYSMGGGNTRGDSLYSFKKRFNRNCNNPFLIGVHVHKSEVYEAICEQWQEKHPQSAAKYGHMLQGYRKLDA